MSNGNARYYNTGKVLIGYSYQRPLQPLTREGEFMQAVLLGQRPAQYWSANWAYRFAAAAVAVFFLLSMAAQAFGR